MIYVTTFVICLYWTIQQNIYESKSSKMWSDLTLQGWERKESNFLLWFIPQDSLDTMAPSFNQCRPIALSCHSANLSSVAFPMLLTPFLALSSLLPLCLCHQPSATSRHTCKPLPLPLLVLPPLEPLKSLFAQLAPYWYSASQRHHPVISHRAAAPAAPAASNAWW